MRFSKPVTILLLAISFSSLSLKSQTKTDSTHWGTISKGSKGLLFQIDYNFSLRSFEGSILSFKYHLSPKSALRISIGGNAESTDTNNKFTSFRNDSSTTLDSFDEEQTVFNLTLATTYLYYPSTTNDFGFYLGIGPQYGFYKRDTKDDTNGDSRNPFDRIRNWDSEEWSIGLKSAIGVEWLPMSNLGILAEYSHLFSYNKSKQKIVDEIYNETEIEETNERIQENEGYTFTPQTVKFGLTLYF